MDATSLASVWATVALFIFLGVLVYLKVPAMIAKAIDARAVKIRHDLDEARRLREEAQALLAEFQKKRKDAEQEAADLVAAAKREAELLLADAHKKTEDYVTRRTAMAEQKIAQAEREAVNEVRSSAVDIAIEAARRLLADNPEIKAGEELFKSSLQELKSKLN
jgi:F-type H+-transporting ATPase subunit b